MIQDSQVIAFPTPAAAATHDHYEAEAGAKPSIIDFTRYRRTAKAKAAAIAADEATRELTPDELRDALNEGRLLVHYQPQYDMRTGQTIAAEALVRLVDRDGELIAPNRFIEVAEESDLIVPLGRAVIDRVCFDLALFRAEDSNIQRIAINLSAHQLNIDTTLPSFIDQMVNFYGLEYVDLEFELTERQRLGPQSKGLAVLNALAHRGARIVIDDFGIGYSSIVYLVELPVSAFKLDRALVSRLPEDRATQALVASLLTFAESLDLEVIAEGIENNVQNEYLVGAGCHYAQGFSYARPMDIADFRCFMSERSSAASITAI